MNEEIKRFPAPWNLNGNGYIIIFKFKNKFVKEEGRVPEFLEGKFCGGIGSVMIVDYKESNAGPYGELLFIPGKFKYRGKKLNTISKIYVSTLESVVNGRENWGIPKEQAEFSFTSSFNNVEDILIKKDGNLVAEFKLKYNKFGFPVSTKLLPFPLVQKYEDEIMYTNFFGKGRGQFAKITDIQVNPKYFPNISKVKPIAVIRVSPFNITFPKANK